MIVCLALHWECHTPFNGLTKVFVLISESVWVLLVLLRLVAAMSLVVDSSVKAFVPNGTCLLVEIGYQANTEPPNHWKYSNLVNTRCTLHRRTANNEQRVDRGPASRNYDYCYFFRLSHFPHPPLTWEVNLIFRVDDDRMSVPSAHSPFDQIRLHCTQETVCASYMLLRWEPAHWW